MKKRIIITGGQGRFANVLKNSTGYNLTQLMVGSEGTLGIITKIIFRLIPLPTKDITMLVPFNSAERACEAVSAVFRAGITPSALEFVDRDAIDWTMKYTDISVTISKETKAHLLIEVDGNDMDILYSECEKIANIMEKFDCGDIIDQKSIEIQYPIKLQKAIDKIAQCYVQLVSNIVNNIQNNSS